MNQDELERIFSPAAEFVPSDRFVKGVMDAVRREASAPPPIPFPWACAVPALLCGALALLALVAALMKDLGRPVLAAPVGFGPLQFGWLRALAHAAGVAGAYGAWWVLLAMLVTAACMTLSMRLTTGSWRTL